MKMVRLAVIGFLFGCGCVLGAEKSISMLLEEAQYQEETVGDVNTAMAIYEKILEDDAARRPEVAKAMYRYGLCLAKKGEKQKAGEIFKDVAEKYSDQKIFALKAQRELDKLSPSIKSADIALDENIYTNLAPVVIEYIGNTYGTISAEAGQKKLYSNAHIYYLTSDMRLLKGGMGYYQNMSGAALTNKIRLSGTTHPNQGLYDIAGRKMDTEIVADAVRKGFYHIYWTPSEPLAPGQFFYYGWSMADSKQLQPDKERLYTLTMENTFGKNCYETFFLVLPESIKIVRSGEESTTKADVGGMSVYAWTKEVPPGETHSVSVILNGSRRSSAKQLETKITVSADKCPDGDRLTVQYGVMAVCEAAKIPYQFAKSQQFGGEKVMQYIDPIKFADTPAKEILNSILKPLGLAYKIDENGLYLLQRKSN